MISDSRGIIFEPFKMLIGGIIALAVLMIIISAIGYLEEIQQDISMRQVFSSFKDASNTPNGSILIARDVKLKEGTQFSPRSFSSVSGLTNLSSDCIDLSVGSLSALDLSGDIITIKSTLLIDVYFRCEVNISSDCEPSQISCEVSFAEPLE